MLLNIHHITTYKYTEEVFVEPHHLYFYPSQRNYFIIRDFEIHLSPDPSGLAFRIDAENNSYYQCWYNQKISEMKINVSMQLETLDVNPFNFLEERNPISDHKTSLQLYLQKLDLDPMIHQWVTNIQKLSGGNTTTFLSFLSREIHSDWEHNERYAENVLHPEECFKKREGSCRDLAWMMVQMLRNQAVPARFVSGYTFNPELDEGHELHAWVEAWIPGAGWIGLDPSSGLLATDQYIPISSSYKPQNTLPVQGTYRGKAASELHFEVQIEALDK